MARLPFLSSGLISLELSPTVFMNIMKLGPTSLSASTDASRFASSISNRCCNRHSWAPILLWCIAFFWITCICVHKVHITWSYFLECFFRCFKFFLLCCNRNFFTPSPIWHIAFLWIISICLNKHHEVWSHLQCFLRCFNISHLHLQNMLQQAWLHSLHYLEQFVLSDHLHLHSWKSWSLTITFEYLFSKLFSLHLQQLLYSFFEFHSLELQPIPIVFVLSQSTKASMLSSPQSMWSILTNVSCRLTLALQHFQPRVSTVILHTTCSCSSMPISAFFNFSSFFASSAPPASDGWLCCYL